MKKLLLSFMILGFLGASLYAQQPNDLKIRSAKADKYADVNEQSNKSGTNPAVIELPDVVIPNDVNVVSPITIGTSANGFGFFVDSRTSSVWADNRLNTISFTHRQELPSSGHLGYDISTDGGATWETNITMYDAAAAGASPARYPQGGFVNPVGNTDPANAIQTYVAPTLDGSQGTSGSWGGLTIGATPFGNPAQQWQANWASDGDQLWFLPDAFHITQQGIVFFIDELTEWDGAASTYLGSITIGKGVYNEDTGEIDYTFQEIDVPVNPEDGINDIEIAFAPDGQTGYISLLTNLEETLPFTSYHPVLYKTTDGGATWSDDPIEVQLGGQGGLTAIQEHLSDEALIAYFDPEPVPPRDEIAYYIGYNQDFLVDAWGNPHISGTVMLADLEAGTIATGGGFIANFHIWSSDGGVTWESFKLADLLQFDATFAGGGSEISQYNRPQISTTWDGSIVFFSWLDSDIEEAEDNSRPDIYFREFFPYLGENGTHGEEVINVTQFSAAMWTANWATMPYYVFTEDMGDNTVQCTIPWVYQKLSEQDPSIPVQFYYIPDFVKTYAITANSEISQQAVAAVSQNYPNPFSNETLINISLVKASDVTLSIYNITGQQIIFEDLGFKNAGSFSVEVSADKLPTGVYFYTVEAGAQKVTRKMIVQ